MDSFFFESPSFTTGAFRVVSIFGEEGMSTPFHFDVIALAIDLEADDVEDRVIGRPARLQLRKHDNSLRSLIGIVRSVRAEGGVGTTRRVRLELVPLLWYIGLRHRSRIFQDRTVPQIVEEILGELHVRFELRLTREYLPREYCVQYQESDADFIARIVADEGIHFFFQSDDVSTTMVFGDSDTAYGTIVGELGIKNRDGQMTAADEHVGGFVLKRSVVPGSVVLRDYDFKRPSLDQTVQVAAVDPSKPDSPGALERYDFPGGYIDPAEGKERARVKLEGLNWDAQLGSGIGTTRRLEPGHTFVLEEHPREAFNRKYVVTRVRHEGHESGISLSGGGASAGGGAAEFSYRCSFECVAAQITYRPPRIPARSVHGAETARVQAEGGSEEILVDEHGRIRVQFPWDREGAKKARTSCFIRVAQAWAGTAFGVVFLPRVGMEVVVSFLGGDPDRPLITGCVYNGEHPHPYKLPENKTRSVIKTQSSPGGNGFNELRFEDKAHAEEIFVHAQKDMNEVVRNCHTLSVGADESNSIGHDQSNEIKNDQRTKVGVNQVIEVGSNRTDTVLGGEQRTIVGQREESVGADENIVVKANRTHEVHADDLLVVHANRVVQVDDTITVGAKRRDVHVETSYDVDVGVKYALQQGGISFVCTSGSMMGTATDIRFIADNNLALSASNELSAWAKTKAAITSPAQVEIVVGGNSVVLTASGIEIRSSGHIGITGKSVTIAAADSVGIFGSEVAIGNSGVTITGLIKMNA